jgi:hypothetical protein
MDFDRSPDDSGAESRIVYCNQIPEFLSSRLMNLLSYFASLMSWRRMKGRMPPWR